MPLFYRVAASGASPPRRLWKGKVNAYRAQAAFLVTYDRRHLLARAAPIKTRFGLIVATPEEILRATLGGAESAQ